MTQPQPSQSDFFKLAIPNILTNLCVPLAGLIDIALLGHLPDITPLAGVALAGLIFDFSYWGFGFLRMSTTGLTAKAFGAKDRANSAAIFFRAMAVGLGAGLVLVALQWPISAIGFGILNGGPEVEAAGKLYFGARIWGAPATMFGYVIVGWLLGRQRSKDALLYALTLNGLNIFLDWVFIYRFGWGARGAGLATMLAEVTACLLGLLLVRRAWKGLPGFDIGFLKDRGAFKRLMILNGNIMVRTFCLITTFAVFTNLSAGFGAVLLAANTILLKLLNTAAYFIDGFAFALESLAGRFAGEENWLATRRSLRMALGWNLAAVALFLFGFHFFETEILGTLTAHEEVIEAGVKYLPWVSCCLLLSGFAYIYDGFFIGLADGARLRVSMMWSTLVGFLPLAMWSYSAKLPMVLWVAMVSFMAIRSATLGWGARQFFKHQLDEGPPQIAGAAV